MAICKCWCGRIGTHLTEDKTWYCVDHEPSPSSAAGGEKVGTYCPYCGKEIVGNGHSCNESADAGKVELPELPRGWVPPFRQAGSGVSSHVIDSSEPANWIGDDTVEVSKFLAELLNAVYLPREGE